jgi:hypothetical protein
MEPGEVGARHSHDVGEELFLILSGQCEFEIEGEYAVLGPGQLCATKINERHSVRVVGDEPMTMFLTVTPHIEPTHTFWDDEGNKLPPRYGGATAAERKAAPPPTEPLRNVVLQFAEALSELTEQFGAIRPESTDLAVKLADLVEDDSAEAKPTLDDLWGQLGTIYPYLRRMETLWNELTQRFVDSHPSNA